MPSSEWDAPGVAEEIDGLWRASAFESAHVAALGDLCARTIASRAASVLEVGCGSGRIYEQLVPRVIEESGYAGVDSSERMLALARRRFPHGRFHRGDGLALELADRAVDYALAFEVAGHLPELGPLLAELGRVSRRAFLLTVWRASEEEGVVDERESIGGSDFLHRRYAASRVLAAIAAALAGRAFEVETTALHTLTWAFVVSFPQA